MGEIRAVDDQKDIRFFPYHRLSRPVDQADQFGQFLEDLREPHDREFGIIKKRSEPLSLERLAADADKFDRTGISGLEGPDQIRAEKIARHFAGDDRHLQSLRHSIMSP